MERGSEASVAIALVLAITVTEAFAQTCLRTACNEREQESAEMRCHVLLALGCVAYSVVAYLLFRVYRYSNLGHTNLVWSCASIVVAFMIGAILFGEGANAYSYAAIGFACVAIYLAHRSAEVAPIVRTS